MVSPFWSFVERGAEADCWEWRGGKRRGYGRYYDGERSHPAHRYAWELTHEHPIFAGLFACHRCDNPGCVNPAHIFPGTPLENTQDMIRKGRRLAPNVRNRPRGDRHPSRTKPERLKRGEDHPAAKLAWADVLEIRAASETGVALARRFGISTVTVSRIRRGLLWRSPH